MSCFILNNESTAALAAMLDRATGAAHWSGTVRYGLYGGKELHFLLSKEWSLITGRRCVELDSQKIYTVLRSMNEQAFGERYRRITNIEPEAMPVGEWVNTADRNPWQMLKTFECFLYQCNEGAVAKSELYQALLTAKNHYMKYLISKLPEYAEANWG